MIQEQVFDLRKMRSIGRLNFRLIKSGINVRPLLSAIQNHPELWDEINLRQNTEGSPHKYTKSIFVRWCKSLDPHSCFNDLQAIDYPARSKMPELEPLISEVMSLDKHMTLGRILIVDLKPGGEIAPHVDEGNVAASFDRYHIALNSRIGNEFHCEHEQVHMWPGELWWFDNKKTHWLKNNSPESRLHLIIDARINH